MSVYETTSAVDTTYADYGPCLWCEVPSRFRVHEGDFCTDEHVSAHRSSEQRLRASADDTGFVAFLRAVSR